MRGNNIKPAPAGVGIPVKKLDDLLFLLSISALNRASLKQEKTINDKTATLSINPAFCISDISVSYTHLTLPTILLV